MLSAPSDHQKLNLLIANAIQKTIHLVIQDRVFATHHSHHPHKRQHQTHTNKDTNSWFNIDSNHMPNLAKQIENVAKQQHNTHTHQITLDIFVDTDQHPLIADAARNKNQDSNLLLLERWNLLYEPAPEMPAAIQWPSFYKRFMVLLRSIAAYLRLLPAHRFAVSFARLLDTPVLQFSLQSPNSHSSMDFEYNAAAPPRMHNFPPPDDKHGKLRISVSHRPSELYGRPPPPPPSASSNSLEGHLIQDYVPEQQTSDERRGGSTTLDTGPSSPPFSHACTPSCTIDGNPPPRANKSVDSTFTAGSIKGEVSRQEVRSGAGGAGILSPQATPLSGATQSLVSEVPSSSNRTLSVVCHSDVPATATDTSGTSATEKVGTSATDPSSRDEKDAAAFEAAHERDLSMNRPNRRRSLIRGESDLPFQMEEDLEEKGHGDAEDEQGRFSESNIGHHEAELGFFMDEMSHAPSLQLFSKGPRTSFGGHSGGSAADLSTSPLARSIDDFYEQLDMFRQFHDTSVAQSMHPGEVDAANSSPVSKSPPSLPMSVSSGNRSRTGSRSGRISPACSAIIFGSSPQRCPQIFSGFPISPMDAPFLQSASSSPTLRSSPPHVGAATASPPLLLAGASVARVDQNSKASCAPVVNICGFIPPSSAVTHSLTDPLPIIANHKSRCSSRASSVAAESPPIANLSSVLGSASRRSSALPVPFPQAGSTGGDGGDSTEELARSPPPEDSIFPFASDTLPLPKAY